MVDYVAYENGQFQVIPGGTGGIYYVFIQPTPSNVWTIAHNLGRYPSVEVVDSSGSVAEGDVRHLDLNNVQLTFSAAFAGQATCS